MHIYIVNHKVCVNNKMEYIGFSRPENYVNDYFKVMQEQENKLKTHYMQSPQIQFRAELLEWIKLVCETTNLSFLTYHHGVLILDAFMDKFDIAVRNLKSVAAVCIMMAAKLEQSGHRLPSYARVFAIDHKEHEAIPSNAMITGIEWKILTFFNHSLLIPTVADFLYFFLPDVVLLEDIKPEDRNTAEEKSLRLDIRDHFQYLLTCIINDQSTLQIPPSWLASACYINARIKFNLLPSWPDCMVDLTGYWSTSIVTAIEVVFKYSRLQDEQEQEVSESISPNDSGYGSSIGMSPPCKKFKSC